jgi:hypothetical protein
VDIDHVVLVTLTGGALRRALVGTGAGLVRERRDSGFPTPLLYSQLPLFVNDAVGNDYLGRPWNTIQRLAGQGCPAFPQCINGDNTKKISANICSFSLQKTGALWKLQFKLLAHEHLRLALALPG